MVTFFVSILYYWLCVNASCSQLMLTSLLTHCRILAIFGLKLPTILTSKIV